MLNTRSLMQLGFIRNAGSALSSNFTKFIRTYVVDGPSCACHSFSHAYNAARQDGAKRSCPECGLDLRQTI